MLVEACKFNVRDNLLGLGYVGVGVFSSGFLI